MAFNVGMGTSVATQTAFVAMITFSTLLYTYYVRDTEHYESLVHFIPSPKFYGREKTTAIQRDIYSAEHGKNKTYTILKNLEQRGISKNISLQKPKAPLLDKGKSACVKQIQYWGKYKMTLSDGEYDCPTENCKARFIQSSKYERLLTSHVVILNHRGSWKWEELARNHRGGQMWIYMTRESPLHSRKARSPDPDRLAFNWTMTYRTDSDFPIPYGRYTEDIPEVHADDSRNWATGKTRLIAWMASNCGVTSWGRTHFVNSLKDLIEVDTYGTCGTLKCPRNEKCDEILSSHKFYLSLENSQCEDYITEKFWRNAFTHNLVPIVYGTTRENYEKVAPPNSFIHLSDFSNMTSLVDYIKYLDKNDTAYNEYFEWRKRGTVSWSSLPVAVSPKILCDIVRRLKDKNTLQVKKI